MAGDLIREARAARMKQMTLLRACKCTYPLQTPQPPMPCSSEVGRSATKARGRLLMVAGRFKAAMVVLVVALSAASCGDDDAIVSDEKARPLTSTTVLVPTDPPLNDQVERVTIDGMPCLVWKDKVNGGQNSAYAYSGLTCDWSKKKEG